MSMEEKKYITLQQFLKLKDIVSSGGEAKYFILENEITVNGETEKRRGRKIYKGDTVTVNGRKYEIDG